MNVAEFSKITNIPQNTARALYDMNHPHNFGEPRCLDEKDVEYVMSRKIENYNGRLANIKGFPNHYISDTGIVYTYARGILEEVIGSIICGYHYVGLSYKHYHKTYRVHRLVGEYFVPNPFNKPVINHKDGNKLNNDYRNLEWATISENTKHAFDNGLARNDIGMQDSQSKPVAFLDLNNILHVFGSASIAERMTQMHMSTILRQAKRNHEYFETGEESVMNIYNNFIFYNDFLKECNEQQFTYDILYDSHICKQLAIR